MWRLHRVGSVGIVVAACWGVPVPAQPEQPPAIHDCQFMLGLEQRFTGRRVVAVCPERHGEAKFLLRPEVGTEAAVEAALRETADEFSVEYGKLLPFKVGRSWTIAWEKMDVFEPKNVGCGCVKVDKELNFLLAALDALSVEPLMSPEGVPATLLPPEAKRHLSRVLGSAVRVGELRTVTREAETGGVEDVERSEVVATFDGPLPLSLLRLRACLVEAVTEGRGDERTTLYSERPKPERHAWPDEEEADDQSWAPNRLKPCDLDTRRLNARLGVSGRMPVRALLDRVQKLIGVRLYSAPLPEIEVFVGSPEVTVGEALDGARLGLEATFRRVPGGYTLAWDVRGLATLQAQRRDYEAEAGLPEWEEQKALADSDLPTRIYLAAPESPQRPLDLSADQRRQLLAARPAEDGRPWGYPLAELRPDQAKAARELFRDKPEAALSIGERFRLDVDVSLPDVGWCRLRSLPFTVLPSEGVVAGDVSPGDSKWLKPKPSRPTCKGLALMTPALCPSRVESLCAMMRDRGIGVLYYPALYGGYATFPSKTFPLHPALRGKDGWAAARESAKRHGIELVATLSVLAWQEGSRRSHWLNGHLDWLERDALGRPMMDRPNLTGSFLFSATFSSPPGIWNIVRAGEPEVRRRLDALLDEFLVLPGDSKVALVDTFPLAPFTVPELGLFGGTDIRMAFLGKHGIDPLDLDIDALGWGDGGSVGTRLLSAAAASDAGSAQPQWDLVRALVDHMREQHPGRTIAVAEGFGWEAEDRPSEIPADAWIEPVNPEMSVFGELMAALLSAAIYRFAETPSPANAASPKPTMSRAFLLHLLPPRDWEEFLETICTDDETGTTSLSPATRDSLRTLPMLATLSEFLEQDILQVAPDALIFDFRACPQDIEASLKWIQPPSTAALKAAR